MEHASEDQGFAGAGDALFCEEMLFAGDRVCSQVTRLQKMGGSLQCRVILLELSDPHDDYLDNCVCSLAPGLAVYFPTVFDESGQHILQAWDPELIVVEPDDVRQFCCQESAA